MSNYFSVKNLSTLITGIIFTTSIVACGGGSDSGNSKPSIKKENETNDICKSTAVNSGQPDLDKDGLIDKCDNDLDGDGIDNALDAKPSDASIAGISKITYKKDGAIYPYLKVNAYFNAKQQLTEKEYITDSIKRLNLVSDDKGRLTRLEEFENNQLDTVKVWVYNDKDQLVEYNVSNDGDNVFEITTAYHYNANGKIAELVKRDTSSSSWVNNFSKKYTYNTLNQATQISTDEGNDGSIDRIANLTYDTKGNLIQSVLYYVEADDNGNKFNNLARTIDYTYDTNDRVIKTIFTFVDSDSRITTYSYNAQGNITRKTLKDNDNTLSLIDNQVGYNKQGKAISMLSQFEDISNIQDVAHTVKYNNKGYLIKTLEDVSNDGSIDKEIDYSYEGNVPVSFNQPEFLDLVGEAFNILPTANSYFHGSGLSYTSNTVNTSCYYDELNIYLC